jgi:hypothetical protein
MNSYNTNEWIDDKSTTHHYMNYHNSKAEFRKIFGLSPEEQKIFNTYYNKSVRTLESRLDLPILKADERDKSCDKEIGEYQAEALISIRRKYRQEMRDLISGLDDKGYQNMDNNPWHIPNKNKVLGAACSVKKSDADRKEFYRLVSKK